MLERMPDSQRDFLHVLVVDDDEDVLHLLSEVLTKEGHLALTASSAEQALELLPRWTFEVAFVDHHLPGMEGVVFGQFLRRNNRDMQIALVTGDDTRRLERQSRELGIAFIRKPFEIKEILRVIEEHRAGEAERKQRAARREGADYDPPFSRFYADLAGVFELPKVPQRSQDVLVEGIKRVLFALRSEARYAERERVAALAGLLTAQVLGVPLPRTDGRTLFEEYDEIMRRHGRRTEFEVTDADGGPDERRRGKG
jgi:CheY-like chemotaxis protein